MSVVTKCSSSGPNLSDTRSPVSGSSSRILAGTPPPYRLVIDLEFADNDYTSHIMSKPLKATVNCDMGEVSNIVVSTWRFTVLNIMQGLFPVHNCMYYFRFIVDVSCLGCLTRALIPGRRRRSHEDNPLGQYCLRVPCFVELHHSYLLLP